MAGEHGAESQHGLTHFQVKEEQDGGNRLPHPPPAPPPAQPASIGPWAPTHLGGRDLQPGRRGSLVGQSRAALALAIAVHATHGGRLSVPPSRAATCKGLERVRCGAGAEAAKPPDCIKSPHKRCSLPLSLRRAPNPLPRSPVLVQKDGSRLHSELWEWSAARRSSKARARNRGLDC